MMNLKFSFIFFSLTFFLLVTTFASATFAGSSLNYNVDISPSALVLAANNSNYDLTSRSSMIAITGSSANYEISLISSPVAEEVIETPAPRRSSGGSIVVSLFGGDVVDNPTTKTVSEGQKVTFLFNEIYYDLITEEITEYHVSLDFTKGDSILKLYVNKSVNLDVNSDGSNDVILNLDEIDSYTSWGILHYRATFTITVFEDNTPVVNTPPPTSNVIADAPSASNSNEDSSGIIALNDNSDDEIGLGGSSSDSDDSGDVEKSSLPKPVIFIIVIVLLVGIGVFVYFKVFANKDKHPTPHLHPDEIPSSEESQPVTKPVSNVPVKSTSPSHASKDSPSYIAIVNFMNMMSARGQSDEGIKKSLVSTGWNPSLVDTCLSSNIHPLRFDSGSVNQVVRFITLKRKQRMKDSIIKEKLSSVGWSEAIIDHSFTAC